MINHFYIKEVKFHKLFQIKEHLAGRFTFRSLLEIQNFFCTRMSPDFDWRTKKSYNTQFHEQKIFWPLCVWKTSFVGKIENRFGDVELSGTYYIIHIWQLCSFVTWPLLIKSNVVHISNSFLQKTAIMTNYEGWIFSFQAYFLRSLHIFVESDFENVSRSTKITCYLVSFRV